MAQFKRRSLLGAAGATLAGAGGATLAGVLLARKPAAQTILSPKPDAAPRLADLHTLIPTENPAPPAAQNFTDADGKPVALADFKGKGMVVNLWATWCVPCVAEMPALDAMSQRLAAEGILVMPLSSDRGGASVVAKFYAAHDIKHLGIWIDARGAAARAWGARGLPTTLIIDREGRERARLEGAIDWSSDDALREIRALV